jgi:hypothetical protein
MKNFLLVLVAMCSVDAYAGNIQCKIVKGAIPNSFVALHGPISLEVSDVALSNARLVRGYKLGSIDINGINLNTAGENVHFVSQSIIGNGSHSRLLAQNGNQQAIFFIKPSRKSEIVGWLVATHLEKGEETVEYNLRCKY